MSSRRYGHALQTLVDVQCGRYFSAQAAKNAPAGEQKLAVQTPPTGAYTAVVLPTASTRSQQ